MLMTCPSVLHLPQLCPPGLTSCLCGLGSPLKVDTPTLLPTGSQFNSICTCLCTCEHTCLCLYAHSDVPSHTQSLP